MQRLLSLRDLGGALPPLSLPFPPARSLPPFTPLPPGSSGRAEYTLDRTIGGPTEGALHLTVNGVSRAVNGHSDPKVQ